MSIQILSTQSNGTQRDLGILSLYDLKSISFEAAGEYVRAHHSHVVIYRPDADALAANLNSVFMITSFGTSREPMTMLIREGDLQEDTDGNYYYDVGHLGEVDITEMVTDITKGGKRRRKTHKKRTTHRRKSQYRRRR
ncbi:MAG: hypothetical protein EB127_22250 [Alphaproteobacteria bacterium]|nr:hypothetical protein [Alphaproteobacteria bacterium]